MLENGSEFVKYWEFDLKNYVTNYFCFSRFWFENVSIDHSFCWNLPFAKIFICYVQYKFLILFILIRVTLTASLFLTFFFFHSSNLIRKLEDQRMLKHWLCPIIFLCLFHVLYSHILSTKLHWIRINTLTEMGWKLWDRLKRRRCIFPGKKIIGSTGNSKWFGGADFKTLRLTYIAL